MEKKVIHLNWSVFQREALQIKHLEYKNSQLTLPGKGAEHENKKENKIT